jgi:putative tryptophan/tyrosine transport system substrate-binding protein
MIGRRIIMKKILALAAALVLVLLTASCALAEEPLKVAIVQLVENGAFKDMREGFIARMRELGYTEDKMVFEEKNASGDMSNLYTIAQGVVDEKVDLIVTIATPATQAVVNLESDIPVFFISVANPIGAGVITDMQKPDKNATGASNAIPISENFKLAAKLTPETKDFGLIYCTSQVNSVTTIENAKKYLSENGYTYKEAVVTASSEVYEAALSLVDQGVDGFFIPNDSVIQDAMEVISQVAKDAKIPVYGSSAVMVNSGAFATISISDMEIGAIVADMVHKHLTGTAVADIPAVVVDKFTTVINKTTADAIGVTVPQDVLDSAVVVE